MARPFDRTQSERREPSLEPSRTSRTAGRHEDGAVARMLRFPGLDPQPSDPLADEARRSDVDEWGRSERARRTARRLGSFYYRRWFRVEWEGIENIPATGGALLVANHAGALPSDAPMIMHGIEEELGRAVYGLADNFFRTIPGVGTAWSRTGGVPAHPDNAYRILRDHQQLALVFPEGSKGPSKLVSERYRLRRFGRGGFVETAMRAGVPVVPIAVIGAEESMPILFRLPAAAKTLKVPYLPVTANHLLFGPVLGSVVYLPAKFRFRVLEPVHFGAVPGLGKYPRGRIMEEAEAIRQQLQDAVFEMLARRRSIWFG
jgi:1-acyl-sn-glycerol-3-phosphate acyltransferase